MPFFGLMKDVCILNFIFRQKFIVFMSFWALIISISSFEIIFRDNRCSIGIKIIFYELVF